jgi:hypothetical protein
MLDDQMISPSNSTPAESSSERAATMSPTTNETTGPVVKVAASNSESLAGRCVRPGEMTPR